MYKSLNKYISFEKHNIIIILSLFLLIIAHIIHLVYEKDRFVFQIIFIIAYMLFIIGEIIENNKINIFVLINKISIILIITFGLYLDYNMLLSI